MRTSTPGAGTRAVCGALALAGVVLIGACSSASSGSEQPASDPFVVAHSGDVRAVDPARAATPQTVHTLDLVYDTLLGTNDEGGLTPGLATRWRVSDGGTTVTFTLRRGVTFHDGAAFTAADAEASLQRLLGRGAPPALRSSLHSIETIATPDAHTLVLHLTRPDTALLTALTSVRASILDSADIDAGAVARRPNGTGPFRWVSGTRGRRDYTVTLAANVGYWNGAPKLARVRLRALPDEAAVVSAVESGDAHLGLVSGSGAVRDAESETIQVMEQPTQSFHTLVLDRRDGPLRERRVRQALACAIDRQQVIETAFLGHGAVTGPVTGPRYDYAPTAGLPCDSPGSRRARQQAEALLTAAGYPRGFTLDTAVPGGRPTVTDVAESLQAQLAQVGVRLRLKQRTDAGNRLAGDLEAAVVQRGGSYDPYLTYAPYFLHGGTSSQPAGTSSGTVDALLRRANSTSDAQQRRKLFRMLHREMLRRSPWVWLVRDPAFYLLGENVRGFRPTPTHSLEHLRGTWLADSASE